MTGDGGENDFGFCSDAPLWRITQCCWLLAGPLSLACVTRASRRVSHNNFACVLVNVYVCVRVFASARAVPPKDLSSMLPERREPGDGSGLTLEPMPVRRSRAGRRRVK